jgi:hypothetical protein
MAETDPLLERALEVAGAVYPRHIDTALCGGTSIYAALKACFVSR